MKKIKRLVLHIGMIKTGSTSIQYSMGESRSALLKQNIYYPTVRPFNHVATFPPLFIDDPTKSFGFRRALLPSEDKDAKVRSYRETWLREFESCEQDNFIISAEDLGLPFFRKKAVALVKEFVEPYFEEVSVIVYVRHYDSFIASHVQEVVKNGDRRDIREIVDRFMDCPPQLSYRRSIRKWIDVFGSENIIVKPFDSKVFYKGSLLADFFHALGLPADDISIPEVITNVSIGKNAVIFINKYNQIYPLFIKKDSIRKLNPERGLAQQIFPFHLFQTVGDEKFKPDLVYSAEQAKNINEEIDFINRYFSDGYQFKQVKPGTGTVKFQSAEDIPIDFFVNLVNNYNIRIETLQQTMQDVKIPLLLQIMDKFIFLKDELFKLTIYNKKRTS